MAISLMRTPPVSEITTRLADRDQVRRATGAVDDYHQWNRRASESLGEHELDLVLSAAQRLEIQWRHGNSGYRDAQAAEIILDCGIEPGDHDHHRIARRGEV